MDIKDIITLVIATTGLLITLINLLYIFSRYNMKIKLVEKIDKINKQNEEFNLSKFYEYFALEKYYMKDKEFERLIILNDLNLSLEKYMINVFNILTSYGLKKYICTYCHSKVKIEKKYSLNQKNKNLISIELEDKLRMMHLYQLVTYEKEKTKEIIFQINDFMLIFPTYLQSSFKFKVHWFWFKNNIIFDFCNECVSKINIEYIDYIDNLYKKVLNTIPILDE